MNKISYALIIMLVTFLAACSSFNVIPVKDNQVPSKKEGLYYALPRTVITVDVTVKKVNHIRGPYALYAKKYLSVKNVILQNTTSYELNDIEINNYIERDPNQFYFVKLGHCKNNKPFLLNLSETGLIYSINDELETNSINNLDSQQKDLAGTPSETFKDFANANMFEKIDTIIEKVNLDTVTIEKKILKKILVEKTTDQKAKEAADFIMRVKSEKFDLLTGFAEVNYQKESIEYMCNQLNKLEEDYLRLFTGITSTKILKYRFTFVPNKEDVTNLFPLFRFSESEGILDTSDVNGINVYIQVKRTGDTRLLANYVNNKENLTKKKKHGFYYRIPEYAKITINYDDIPQADATLLVNQFGVVTHLPVEKLKVQLYPGSGAVKSIEIE